MGRGIYIFGISPTEQEESAARAVCLGSHAARGDYGPPVIRLVWVDSARTTRVVAVVVVARLARRAWWLWLGSHDARAQREVQLAPHND